MSATTREELQFYEENKEKLIAALNTRGRVIDSKNSSGFVGLLNQGATCYLNSLLQCLFYDLEFRNAIYAAGDSSIVVKALQQQFASMQLSDCGAISTKDLSDAFGWSKSQVFEQHDVHELFSVLIDALSQSSSDLSASLLTLFQGTARDVLICPSCSNRRECETTFLNLSLDLPDNLEQIETTGAESAPKDAKNVSVNLVDILPLLAKPETLDVDNKWECSGCSKRVQATKAQEFDCLPPRLFVHLKRFRFDPITRRRRKLSVPVMFPNSLDAHALLGAATTINGDKAAYDLTGILVHNGTAMGGHYRSYVRAFEGDKEVWLDCNDASISPLTPAEQSSLFWFNCDSPKSTAAAVDDYTRTSQVYESAYLLIYSKAVPGERPRARVPAALAAEIAVANEELVVLRRLLEVHRQMVEITVYFSTRIVSGGEITGDAAEGAEEVASDNSRKYAFYFVASTSLADVHKAVFDKFASAGFEGASSSSLTMSRLRRYNAISNRVGETYGGRDAGTLEALGLGPTCVMLLERRSDADAPFVEFNPREMQIRLLLWDQQAFESGTAKPNYQIWSVTVPGEDGATVSGLREAAATAVGIPGQLSRINLIINNPRTLVELTTADNDKLLKRNFDLWPGDEVVVELQPEESIGGASQAFAELKKKRKTIRVLYNDPSGAGAEPSYTMSVETTTDKTLGEIKAIFASALGVAVEAFHMRRSAMAPQLKDESKTLEELGIVDQSIFHLQAGVGCRPGEHMLRFELDTDVGDGSGAAAPELVAMGELAVKEKLTVLQLKELLMGHWATLTAASGSSKVPPTPPLASHFRIRDGKNSQASGPLRDDRVLVRCLMGLADGRRIVVQVLPQAEVIGPDDIVVGLRLASYESKILSNVMDFPLQRSTTICALYASLLAKFPQLNEEPPAGAAGDDADADASAPAAAAPAAAAATGDDGATTGDALDDAGAGSGITPPESKFIAVAKGYTSGPPLTLKTALKLKWNDPPVLRNGDVTIDRPPLNLRDGAIIVVRGVADFARARAAAIARRESEGPRPVSAGTGAAAVRAKSAAARKRLTAQAAQAAEAKEKGLRINTGREGGAPPLPQPSPEKK